MAENRPSSAASTVPLLVPMGSHAGSPPLPLKRLATLVGRAKNCHMHLISSQISKYHAVILSDDAGCVVRDLASRTHTYVNGKAVREHTLADGDLIRIGRFTLKFSAAKFKPKNVPAAPAARVVVEGGSTPVPFDGRVIVIGRRPNSDLTLLEESVSTTHAILFEAAGKHHLRDLGSRTGTFVHGEPIHQVELRLDDPVRIGESNLRLATSEPIDELEDLVGTAPLVSDAPDLDLAPLEELAPDEGQPPAASQPPEPDLHEIDLAHDESAPDGTAVIPLATERAPGTPSISSKIVDEVAGEGADEPATSQPPSETPAPVAARSRQEVSAADTIAAAPSPFSLEEPAPPGADAPIDIAPVGKDAIPIEPPAPVAEAPAPAADAEEGEVAAAPRRGWRAMFSRGKTEEADEAARAQPAAADEPATPAAPAPAADLVPLADDEDRSDDLLAPPPAPHRAAVPAAAEHPADAIAIADDPSHSFTGHAPPTPQPVAAAAPTEPAAPVATTEDDALELLTGSADDADEASAAPIPADLLADAAEPPATVTEAPAPQVPPSVATTTTAAATPAPELDLEPLAPPDLAPDDEAPAVEAPAVDAAPAPAAAEAPAPEPDAPSHGAAVAAPQPSADLAEVDFSDLQIDLPAEETDDAAPPALGEPPIVSAPAPADAGAAAQPLIAAPPSLNLSSPADVEEPLEVRDGPAEPDVVDAEVDHAPPAPAPVVPLAQALGGKGKPGIFGLQVRPEDFAINTPPGGTAASVLPAGSPAADDADILAFAPEAPAATSALPASAQTLADHTPDDSLHGAPSPATTGEAAAPASETIDATDPTPESAQPLDAEPEPSLDDGATIEAAAAAAAAQPADLTDTSFGRALEEFAGESTGPLVEPAPAVATTSPASAVPADATISITRADDEAADTLAVDADALGLQASDAPVVDAAAHDESPEAVGQLVAAPAEPEPVPLSPESSAGERSIPPPPDAALADPAAGEEAPAGEAPLLMSESIVGATASEAAVTDAQAAAAADPVALDDALFDDDAAEDAGGVDQAALFPPQPIDESPAQPLETTIALAPAAGDAAVTTSTAFVAQPPPADLQVEEPSLTPAPAQPLVAEHVAPAPASPAVSGEAPPFPPAPAPKGADGGFDPFGDLTVNVSHFLGGLPLVLADLPDRQPQLLTPPSPVDDRPRRPEPTPLPDFAIGHLEGDGPAEPVPVVPPPKPQPLKNRRAGAPPGATPAPAPGKRGPFATDPFDISPDDIDVPDLSGSIPPFHGGKATAGWVTTAFDGLAMPPVRERDVFSDADPSHLSDAAFGGASLRKQNDVIVPETPDAVARNHAHDEDFAESDWWDRTDDEDGDGDAPPPLASDPILKSVNGPPGAPPPPEAPRRGDEHAELDELLAPLGGDDDDDDEPAIEPEAPPRRRAARNGVPPTVPPNAARPPRRAEPAALAAAAGAGADHVIFPKRRGRYAVPLLLLAMLVCMGAAGAGIWYGMAPHARIAGSFYFKNFTWLDRTSDTQAFEAQQRRMLKADETRQLARSLLGQRSPDVSPGFLADPLAFAAAADRARFTPNAVDGKPGVALAVEVEGTDGDADRARVRAWLEALYTQNGTAYGAARTTQSELDAAVKAVADDEAKRDELRRQSKALFDVITAAPTAVQLADVTNQNAALRAAYVSAQEELERAQAALDKLKSVPADGSGAVAAGAPAEAAQRAAAASDPQLDAVHKKIADLAQQLADAKARTSQESDAASAALRDALGQFGQQVSSAADVWKDDPQLQKYFEAAASLQRQARDLTTELIQEQVDQQRQLGDLKRSLDQDNQQRKEKAWAADKELQDLIEQRQIDEHKYNAAKDSGTYSDSDLAALKLAVQADKDKEDARRNAVSVDTQSAALSASVQAIIDGAQQRLDQERKRIDTVLNSLEQQLEAAAPSVEKLPAAQQALARQIKQQMAAVNAARARYAASVADPSTQPSSAGLAQIQTALADAKAQADRLEKQAAARNEQQLSDQQKAALAQARDAAAQRLAAARKAEADAKAAYAPVAAAAADATVRADAAAAAREQYDQVNADLTAVNRDLELKVKFRDQKQLAASQALDVKPVSDADVVVTRAEDRRLPYALGAFGGIATLFAVLALLASRNVHEYRDPFDHADRVAPVTAATLPADPLSIPSPAAAAPEHNGDAAPDDPEPARLS